MKVKPILDKWEIKGIEAITSLENRKLVEHRVPGKTGNVYQDLGSRPTEITISGSLHGDEVRDGFLEEARKRYKSAEPVTFVADITTATEVKHVVVKALHFAEKANDPDQFRYKMVLKESPPPPPPMGDIDMELGDLALEFPDMISLSLDLLNLLGIPELQDPTPPLKSTLDGVKSTLGDFDGVTSALSGLFGDGE
ncbi:MAG: hypothetical protein GY765_10810 [bacterium]|nr:hypothetical protein [bacterium]